jgi:hypothetical protein
MSTDYSAPLIENAAPTMKVRFVVAKKTASEKSPKFRAYVSLIGPLTGLCLDFPIFAKAGGDFSVAVPTSYGTEVLAVDPVRVEGHDGRTILVANTEDSDGREALDRLLPEIKLAFLNWTHAPLPKPSEYNIAL